MERKIDVTWEGNPDAKENMAGYANTMDPKTQVELANNSYYHTKEDHPWRGKSAFGFATILNRNSCDDNASNPAAPLAVNLPPLQSYHGSTIVDKTKLSAHKVPNRSMPTPIAPLGDNSIVDMANRSLKLKIKKKHVDISPAYTNASGTAPMLAPSPSNSSGRKLPLAPAPSMDDEEEESGDENEDNSATAGHGSGGAALRGGRWTSEEHERFLQGFRLHGHKWKRVQMVVRSRTVTQVRTHAQKYLLKLQKMSGGEQPRPAAGPEPYIAPSQYSSGATSPTQSMTSPQEEEIETASQQESESPVIYGDATSPTKYRRNGPGALRKIKTLRKQQKRIKRNDLLEGSSNVHIEEAAYTLCALMKEPIDDLEIIMTDHEDDAVENEEDDSTEEESMDSEVPTSPVSDTKKRYLCRKCRVPKKGHVCPEDASRLSLKKMSLAEKSEDEDGLEPVIAEWKDIQNYVGSSIVRCFGRNVWCRGTIDQIGDDQIHIVYSEPSNGSRHEWLRKADAIECVAIEGMKAEDGTESLGVFSGSTLKKRKLWSHLAPKDDYGHRAKRLCSP
ncbi:hypothetical protein THRCLA_11834 [Thraustotheca clavata]|uniref:Uncharacterized protein n=1 Tax=Thraustotheca clavata TaxID=74557 RepID=A0A1V9Y6F9_9STRA|nr:hypothetical protein THRCLA_11834 [Thraustotheca clavata]